MDSRPDLQISLRIALLLIIFTVSGCDTQQSPISIGTNVWPGYEPLYLAREQGLFSEEQIHLVEYTSASQVLNAYRNGVLQAAALTLDEAIILLSEGYSVNIILVMDISHGSDAILGQQELTNFKDLKDKRVGVENTALGAYFLSRALQVNNIDEQDVIIVPVELQQHISYFTDREIDAIVTFEPTRSVLLQQGAVILFDSSMIPNEIVDVLIVNDETFKNKKPILTNLKNAWFKSIQQVKTQDPEVMGIINRRLKLDNSSLKLAYEGLELPDPNLNSELTDGQSPGLMETAELLIHTMKQKDLIKTAPSAADLFAKIAD